MMVLSEDLWYVYLGEAYEADEDYGNAKSS